MEDDNVGQPAPVLQTGHLSATATDVTSDHSLVEDTHSQRLKAILAFTKKDLIAADLKWSLFVAASQSYKQDFCVRPFPLMYSKDGNKDFLAMADTIDSVPAFTQLEQASQLLSKSAVDLLHWVLIELKEPSFSVVDKSEMKEVVMLVPSEIPAPSPSLVVRLGYNHDSPAEVRWNTAQEQHGSIFAFHGSRVVYFHSILHHGLQQHLTKNALFGQGVYLSSELLVCLPYSRTGLGWTHSVLGQELSVVALCELIDHPTVLCQSKGDTANKSRAMAQDSEEGEVPNKLYVVPNSDLVRVRYLLVYKSQTTLQAHRMGQNQWALVAWLGQHKMVASLAAYTVMLAAVGLSRSPSLLRWWYDLSHSLGLR